MRHLYVTDMDGTLLNHDSRLSQRTISILADLTRQGVLFTVATARTPATVDPLLSPVRPSAPAVVMTGAALWDFDTRRYIHPIFIPRRDVGPILDECRRRDINPFIYTLGDNGILDVYIDRPLTHPQQHFIDDRSNMPLKRFHIGIPFDLNRDGDKVILIYIMGEIQRLNSLADTVRHNSECAVSAYADIFDPTLGNVEIFAPGVSKASGVRRLAKLVGATGLTVFGDNLNDLPMMAVATRSIAVGNALDSVKQAADITIGPNTTDAVPLFIAREVTGSNPSLTITDNLL